MVKIGQKSKQASVKRGIFQKNLLISLRSCRTWSLKFTKQFQENKSKQKIWHFIVIIVE